MSKIQIFSLQFGEFFEKLKLGVKQYYQIDFGGKIQMSYIDKCIGDCVKKGIDKYPLDQLICILSRCLDGPDERKEAELRAETNKL